MVETVLTGNFLRVESLPRHARAAGTLAPFAYRHDDPPARANVTLQAEEQSYHGYQPVPSSFVAKTELLVGVGSGNNNRTEDTSLPASYQGQVPLPSNSFLHQYSEPETPDQ